MTRRLQIALYAGFAVACLALGFVLTFPYEALGRRIESEATRAMPGSTLVINRIGPAFPVGVYLGDVVFEQAGKDDKPGAKLALDSVRVRPAFLSLLTGKLGASFKIEALAGQVTGKVVAGKDSRKIEAKLDSLQLDDGGQLERLTGLQLLGTVSGKVDLLADAKGVITDGVINANVDGGKIKGGKVMGFTLPPLDLGTPEVDIAIEKGEAKINRLAAKSADAELSVNGSVTMRQDVMMSLVKGALKVRPTDPWLNKNPAIKGMLSMAGPFKKPDGTIELQLNGPLARPVSLMPRF